MDDHNFADELRMRTRGEHSAANVAVNITAPLALTSPNVYRNLVASFYWVFKAMEEELERCRLQHLKIGPIYFRKLLRTRAFEEDLLYYYGSNYATEISPPSAATAAYVNEMRESVAAEPVVLIAYCQTMYIGALSGGAIVKTWVRKAFSAPEGTGTSIFDFSETIKDIPRFKKEYEEALNSIALSRGEKDRIIARKKRIFELNNSIFAELRTSRTYKLRVLWVISRVAAIFIALFFIARLLQSRGSRRLGWLSAGDESKSLSEEL